MNPKLGDVAVKVGGKTYTLNMGVNAMCCVEEASGESAAEIVDRLLARTLWDSQPEAKRTGPRPAQPRVRDVRVLFWGGLQAHHTGIDIDAAGEMQQALNTAGTPALGFVLDSMRLCAPERDDDGDDAEAGVDATADPPQSDAAAGTGTVSS